MKQPLTTYRVIGKSLGLVFLFKYDLNGHLKGFEIAEGQLTDKQIVWLFAGSHFPARQNLMTEIWMKERDYKDKFTVEVSVADISFEVWWEMFGYKVKKDLTIKAWAKLSEAEQIKAFLAFPNYQEHLRKTQQAKAHPVTWLNQKRFNDEY